MGVRMGPRPNSKNCRCVRPITTVLKTWMLCRRCKGEALMPATWIKFTPNAYDLRIK